MEIVLEANHDYYGPKPKIDKLVFKIVPEDSTATAALQSGQIDLMYVRNAESYSILKKDGNVAIDETQQTGTRYLVFNLEHQPFDNPLVRRAIAHAIDKSAIVAALGGTGSKADNVLSPAYLGFSKDVPAYDYDPQKAKSLLEQAGYGGGLKVRFASTQLAPWPVVAPILVDNLKAVGLDVTFEQFEHGMWRQVTNKGNFDITVEPLTRPPDPDFVLTTLFHSSSFPPGSNIARYKGSDQLISEQRVALDDQKRGRLVEQAVKRILTDLPVVPLFYQQSVVARKPSVKGHPVGIMNEFWAGSMYVGNK